jgi:peptidoglycan/xylan/chitin deacetylase (PgdA/CDA1 family)
MMLQAPRWSLERGRLGRNLLVVLTVAAVSIGCVADTSAAAGLAQGPVVPAAVGPASMPTPGLSSPSPRPNAWFMLTRDATDGRPRPGQPNPPADPHVSVPILYYHRVQAPPVDFPHWSAAHQKEFLTYDVLPVAFAAQLDWLRQHGYTTILPRDLTAHWDYGVSLPERPVIITFDDGSRDWIKTVMPMLRARGMVAEFYLTLDAIAHGNLTWPQMRRLIAAGNGVGAHDVHHVQLAAFHNGHPDASPATMAAEVGGARQIIGQHLGVFPDSMAYVGGGFDAALLQAVRAAGYTSARSILRGIATDPPERYKLPVVRIGVHDDVIDLLHGLINPALPTFTVRMRGVSDKASKSD